MKVAFINLAGFNFKPSDQSSKASSHKEKTRVLITMLAQGRLVISNLY